MVNGLRLFWPEITAKRFTMRHTEAVAAIVDIDVQAGLVAHFTG